MDRSWVFGKQFTTVYVKGVEEFMKFVSERYLKTNTFAVHALIVIIEG